MKFDLCLARDNAAKHHIEFFYGGRNGESRLFPKNKLQT